MPDEYEPYVDSEELKLANARCDAELKSYGYTPSARVRCGWNVPAMICKGPLTDKAIEKYHERGFYDQDYKDARNKLMQKKSARNGNFVQRDGRLIYSPI